MPFIWTGTLLQFFGLAIMPFALLVLSGRGTLNLPYVGEAAAALAFLMVGVGLHTAQTAGVALATDLAPAESRPRVVALLYVMLLIGMVTSSLVFGALLRDFDHIKLIKIVQGAAVVTMVLNIVALWKQEARVVVPAPAADEPAPSFRKSMQEFLGGGASARLLVAVGLGGAVHTEGPLDADGKRLGQTRHPVRTRRHRRYLNDSARACKRSASPGDPLGARGSIRSFQGAALRPSSGRCYPLNLD